MLRGWALPALATSVVIYNITEEDEGKMSSAEEPSTTFVSGAGQKMFQETGHEMFRWVK